MGQSSRPMVVMNKAPRRAAIIALRICWPGVSGVSSVSSLSWNETR